MSLPPDPQQVPETLAWPPPALRLLVQIRRPRELRYGVAVGAPLVALALAHIGGPLYRAMPGLPAVLAVSVATLLGGFVPGLVSALVCAVVSGLQLWPLAGAHGASAVGELLELAVVAAVAALGNARLEDWSLDYRLVNRERARWERLVAERESLVAQERAGRSEAEAAQRRLALLVEAGNLLMASRNEQLTVERLARLAVEHVCDWCAVDLLHPDGTVQRAAVASADPSQAPLVEALMQYPPDLRGGSPVAKALMAGQAVVGDDPSEMLAEAAATCPAYARALNALGVHQYMVVPLAVGGPAFGTLLLVVGTGRALGAQDLAVAQVMAHRASLSLENARLHQSAAAEIAERTRVQAELADRQEEIEALNARLQRAMREAHHRVKNNLQVMAALVDMQVVDGRPAVPASEMERLAGQIRALATVHDALTDEATHDAQGRSMSSAAMLGKLIASLRQTCGAHSLTADVADVRLSARQSTALALVTNELVGNAVKHGNGEVELHFAAEAGSATLVVCDDGPGFPPEFDPAAAAHTGLDLVENLGRWDLAGTVSYGNRPHGGGRVEVVIPLEQPAAA